MNIHILALASLTVGISHAQDFTVEEKSFQQTTTLNATFLPTQSQSIALKPKVWTDFKVTSLVAQGGVVKKGDTLIGLDVEAIDKYIIASEKAISSGELSLAQTMHDLKQLELSTPRSLAAYDRADKRATEYLQWYTNIGHPKQIESTKLSLKRMEQGLSYQMEELKQLEKMYGEDNKTEETEEIILTRTRNAVERAKFALKSAKIETTKALTTDIPNQLKDAQLSAESAKISNASAKEKLPRELKLKQLAAAKASKNHTEAIARLAKLKADRTLMNITAPADGVVYYGAMDQGYWSPAAAAKVLKVGGKLPAHLTLLTFIPSSAALELSAFAPENHVSRLSKGAKAFATTPSAPHQQIPVTISSVASFPETNGSYHVTLQPTLPKGLRAIAGMKATVNITTASVDKALLIPNEYLKAENGKHSVKLKLADGKTETRIVTVATSNKTHTVITKGLEKGQVIVK